MFDSKCPICRGDKIEHNQCLRCGADLAELRNLEGKLFALYSAIFMHLRCNNYSSAIDLIAQARGMRDDRLLELLEKFIQSLS